MMWELDGVGTASQAVQSVEEAGLWLLGSVERARRVFDSEMPWRLLMESAIVVRAQMLDAGRQALEGGEPWSSAENGVKVWLSPRSSGP
jgi:hypothetical protein